MCGPAIDRRDGAALAQRQAAKEGVWSVVTEQQRGGKIVAKSFTSLASATAFFDKQRMARLLLGPKLEELDGRSWFNFSALGRLRLHVEKQREEAFTVVVHRLTGEFLEVMLPLSATVADVKDKISLLSGVPAHAQKLVLRNGTTVVQNEETFASYGASAGATVSLALIVDLSDIERKYENMCECVFPVKRSRNSRRKLLERQYSNASVPSEINA